MLHVSALIGMYIYHTYWVPASLAERKAMITSLPSEILNKVYKTTLITTPNANNLKKLNGTTMATLQALNTRGGKGTVNAMSTIIKNMRTTMNMPERMKKELIAWGNNPYAK